MPELAIAPALGTVTLQVEELGRRFILHEQIASGETAEGREFYVARSIGGVALMIVVDGGGSYLIDLKPAVGHVLELDAERRRQEERKLMKPAQRWAPAVCESCKRPFSAQEARAGYTTCEHCDFQRIAEGESRAVAAEALERR